jgi:hypothetical protein
VPSSGVISATATLHANVLGLAPDDTRVDDAVLGLVAGRCGSISAEHGVGGPAGILNPGVIL